MSYTPKNHIRIITAASLFDGHDASINIMRRILQDFGCEVIHLGHNRSVHDIVRAALQEGAQGICISSYQGGHMEYFKYTKDLLDQAGASYVKIWGGGGGVIVHEEKKELEDYGIAQIFHPEDGRRLGLEGMIEMIVKGCDFDVLTAAKNAEVKSSSDPFISDLIKEKKLGLYFTAIDESKNFEPILGKSNKKTPLVLGITGTGGAGKSSLVDEIVLRFNLLFKDSNIAVFCVDPTKRKTGGALLGDRIRMNSLESRQTFMRSIASRGSGKEISSSLPTILNQAKKLGQFDLIIAETSGIGQADGAITEFSDISMYVMTSEFGAQSQLEKIDMIDYADIIAINKADRKGALDALRDVRKQYRRSRKLFHEKEDNELPVFLTQASQFNDEGVNYLFFNISDHLNKKGSDNFLLSEIQKESLISNL